MNGCERLCMAVHGCAWLCMCGRVWVCGCGWLGGCVCARVCGVPSVLLSWMNGWRVCGLAVSHAHTLQLGYHSRSRFSVACAKVHVPARNTRGPHMTKLV